MDDGSDPPTPPGRDPATARAGATPAADPTYDPTTYEPGSFAIGNYGKSQWILGTDNCADFYDDQGGYETEVHYISIGRRQWVLGASFAEAQVHAKVDCADDGKGNCVIASCGGTMRTTGGGYNGPGPNDYWGSDTTNKSQKLSNTTCDLNVGSYSAISDNRQFKAKVTAKIPVDGRGLPIQADASLDYTDNGGVIYGHKISSDSIITCKARGVK